MKLLFKIFALITFTTICMSFDTIDHEAIIFPYVETWNNECISQLSHQDLVTITDTVLLSYYIVQASLEMAQARLVIQSELFNIVTLSINDTFDVSLQVQNNDFTLMKQAITVLEESQEKIKNTCTNLKLLLPQLVHINPLVIQRLIVNFKSIILDWVKTQESTINNFELVKQEFITNAHLFSHVNNVFQTIIATESAEHSQLLRGTNCLTDMYDKIEDTFAHLTATRQQGIAQLDTLLTLFFKYHYQVLYDKLQEHNQDDIKYISTESNKPLNPDQIFIIA